MLRRRKHPWLYLVILVSWLAAASGCEDISWDAVLGDRFPGAAPGGTSAPEAQETIDAQPTATQTPAESDNPTPAPELPTLEGELQSNVLRVWLPPQFDPEAATPAGKLLLARLDQFRVRYPDIRLEVRIKAEDGPGGLLAALSAASVSAPLTLPDVVALPRPFLETAALKGVIFQMDGLPVAEVDGFLTEPDWYPYAVQMGRLQDNTFGLPFASDLLVMASRSAPEEEDAEPEAAVQPTATETAEVEEAVPFSERWARLFETGEIIAFPGADPHSLFTLLLYRASGGQWIDTEGRPYLDPVPLERVLAFYQQASNLEVLPYWLSQYETEAQVWEVFENGESQYIATWASQALAADALAELPLTVEAIPTLDGPTYTLATGWVWAVASPDPERRLLAGELAAFLVDSSFLGEWNGAAGYLPPRASALSNWGPAGWRELVGDLSAAAELLPPGDVLSVLGPPLSQATVDTLKLVLEPATAAQEALSALNNP